MSVTLTINGESRTLDADPTTPLLWALRDEAGLMGTKFGCGIAQCGSCTVHLNGQPVRSCSIPVSAVLESEITTIEGLSPTGDHPLQKAWVEHAVPQCGYCQTGQIMTAAAFVDSTPEPTQDQISEAMNGCLCRCGTYARIRRGVARAAEIAAEV